MTDCADSRWMPPSPHLEAILDVLRRGRAHIEERGHDLSPLFVYEDGGAMELSLLRVVDGTLMAVADAALPETSTKHVDVCGTIDELKRLWEQQPELADTDAARLHELLAHVLKMLRRIEQRLTAYDEFAAAVGACAATMGALQHPDHAPVPALHRQLSDAIAAGGTAMKMAPHLVQRTFDPSGFNRSSFKLNFREQPLHSMTIPVSPSLKKPGRAKPFRWPPSPIRRRKHVHCFL